MRHLFVCGLVLSFFLALPIPLTVAAPPLPDYEKDGTMIPPVVVCDSGTTVWKNYIRSEPDVDWNLVRGETPNVVFYNLWIKNEDRYGRQTKGPDKVEWKSKGEIEAEIQKLAPDAYNFLTNQKHNCVVR